MNYEDYMILNLNLVKSKTILQSHIFICVKFNMVFNKVFWGWQLKSKFNDYLLSAATFKSHIFIYSFSNRVWCLTGLITERDMQNLNLQKHEWKYLVLCSRQSRRFETTWKWAKNFNCWLNYPFNSTENKGSFLPLLVPWRTFNILGTFQMHKRFYKVKKKFFRWLKCSSHWETNVSFKICSH